MSVIEFLKPVQEQADALIDASLEADLAGAFDRERIIEDGIEGMAMLLYRLRSTYIGGMCLPWGMLTVGQKDGYKAEVSALIKGAK